MTANGKGQWSGRVTGAGGLVLEPDIALPLVASADPAFTDGPRSELTELIPASSESLAVTLESRAARAAAQA